VAAFGVMNKAASLSICLAAIAALAVVTPVGANLWSLATAQGFFIPAESSIFTFRATKENEGSGEWWLYGEDGKRLFALHPTDPFYISASRQEQTRCARFDRDNQNTWCSPTRHPLPTQ
jgi:hypothetical protein